MKTAFEHHPCSRCGGAGHFRDFSHVQGGECFKCGGRGFVFTKRGRKAQDFYAASLRIPASEVRPGMIVSSAPLNRAPKNFFRVVSVEILLGALVVNGREICKAEETVRIAHSDEEKKKKIVAAVAFQATLTKSGTIRKR